ncbi:MAG: ATP synthase subunit I [Rickettsiales bacterium]|jgi:hypothetical protein|nr:ATP synthase subunit I [Rickettsiales bacterium]
MYAAFAISGFACGLAYFGSVWKSARRASAGASSAARARLDFLLRLSVLGCAAYVALRHAGAVGGGWPLMLAGLAGFVIGKIVVIWRVRREHESR